MEQEQLEYFKEMLTARLDELLGHADATVVDMTDEKQSFPDPTDRASAESDRNFVLRLRDRERKLIVKIREAPGTDRRGNVRHLRGLRRGNCHQTS